MAEPAGTDTVRHAVIAGVNKAGTTSLFVSLGEHPRVVASRVKETRYFLPVRWGRPLPPFEHYEAQFPPAPPGSVRLEASPSYFYGGAPLARAIAEHLPGARIVVVLREPVARAVSFFRYQKTRLRIPADLSFADYLAEAHALGDRLYTDPACEPWFAEAGGRYADHLPGWIEVFGPGAVRILWFEDLVADPAGELGRLAEWLGLDPALLPRRGLAAENRTTGYRVAGLQRLALAFNDRGERLLRRVPGVKRALRRLYYRLNGRELAEEIPGAVLAELAARYEEPNRRLAGFLASWGVPAPGWLPAADPGSGAGRAGVSAGTPDDVPTAASTGSLADIPADIPADMR